MASSILMLISVAYLVLLFGFAFIFRRYDSFSNSKYAYALSICVYCTAWTFYGSIGRSAETGFGYLGVYLGPTIIAPLMFLVLTKTIKISKYLRISSLADFISARYGKDTSIGTIVTILSILIVIPYISIQLKALDLSFNLLSQNYVEVKDFGKGKIISDPSFYFGIICALISCIFGTVKAAPTDRHPGVISVVAVESIFKLLAFLVGAIVIIFYLSDGVGSIFKNYQSLSLNNELLDLKKLTQNGNQWFWISFISAFAFLLLPRQFHMSVIENKDVEHVKFASWFVPLYLFAISIFVVPIALKGIFIFGNTIPPDTYFTNLLLSENLYVIALIVFIGGIAASTGMMISSLISLSIMMSNHLLLPSLLKFKTLSFFKLEDQIIQFRRLLIFVILLLSYLFYKHYAINYSLVSIGLISFVGICQLIPSYLLGLYWKPANSKGAKAGLLTGIAIWAYTLPVVNLCEIGILNQSLLTEGLLGCSFLKPQAFLGIEGMDPISLSSFISLTANLTVTCIVSLNTKRKPLEISQSDIYLHPNKYVNKNKVSVLSSQANFEELKSVLNEILGTAKVELLLNNYLKVNNMERFQEYADTALIQYIENYLTGSLGSAGTRIILDNIVQHQPVQPELLFNVLDQTNQLYEYAKELEEKQAELTIKTDQLFEANNKLIELDQLKNEFISNITHELRTPLTSIHSLADSLNRYELTEAEETKVIRIIKKESERISNLVNQVLDLRKLETVDDVKLERFNVKKLLKEVIESLEGRLENRTIKLKGDKIELYSDFNKLKQIILNIFTNAVKFTDAKTGQIKVRLEKSNGMVKLQITDNGVGIPAQDLLYVFDRFYQASNVNKANKEGTGLGLSISKHLTELLKGNIYVKSIEHESTKFTIEIKDYA